MCSSAAGSFALFTRIDYAVAAGCVTVTMARMYHTLCSRVHVYENVLCRSCRASLLCCLDGKHEEVYKSDESECEVPFLFLKLRSGVHVACLSELCCSSLKAEQVYGQMDAAGHH